MLNFRQILRSHELGQLLTAAEAALVVAAVQQSPAFTARFKASAARSAQFTVQLVGARRLRMLCLVHNGALIPLPLSKLEAKRTAPPSARAKVMACCRKLVAEQITEYRRQFWADYAARVRLAVQQSLPVPSAPSCPLSGKSLRSNATHVDHIVPFVRLVEQWLAAEQLTPDQITCRRNCFASAKLNKSWQQYHLKHAQLQLTEARANMRKGAR